VRLALALFCLVTGCTSYWQYQAQMREKGQLHWEQVQADPKSTGWQKFGAWLGKPLNTPPESCKQDAKRPECVHSALKGAGIGAAGAVGTGVGTGLAVGNF
jgi:hypothetical protein